MTTLRQRLQAPSSKVWRLVLVALLIGMGLMSLFGMDSLVAQSQTSRASVITIEDTIQSRTAKFLARGIDAATEQGSALLIVQLDTPGGLLSSTRDMVEEIMASPIPVVVFVAPSGAQAASAGTFILASGHVAAMAPSTNVGAASPVSGSGEDLPDTLKSKATQDAAAFLRSIAEERGRNSDALEATVLEAKAYTAIEALNLGVINLVARDLDDLLDQLHGRHIALSGRDVVLNTTGMRVVDINKTPLEHFLGFLASPNIAFLLLALGALGIVIELFNFGMLVPGVIGGILLALGLVGIGNLPVNWAAFGLLAFSMLLIYLEIQAPGFGIFGVGAIISFIIGAFFLFGRFSFDSPAIDSPSFRVSIWLIAVITALMAGIFALFLRFASQAQKIHYPSGISTIVGDAGVVMTAIAPRGTVRVDGELWSAVSDSDTAIAKGASIVVESISGVTLKVRPVEAKEETSL
ncbi:MAG: nodulation protein NfeD [Chloroflexi bacterium]|nr:nodulation protein NfeD [Chloroflexota bacterium]